MNERIDKLFEQALEEFKAENKYATIIVPNPLKEKFAELIVQECIGILETEIELVKGYKSTACNDFDVRWHQGKIEHFAKLVEQSKKHFGVEE